MKIQKFRVAPPPSWGCGRMTIIMVYDYLVGFRALDSAESTKHDSGAKVKFKVLDQTSIQALNYGLRSKL